MSTRPPPENHQKQQHQPNYSKINFPLYSIAALSSNHVIVSGGGGDAKTGVFNGFAVCEITYEENVGRYVASEISRVETSSSIMNSAIGSYNNGKRMFLALGISSDCCIYQVKITSNDNKYTSTSTTTNKNKHSQSNVNNEDVRQRNKSNNTTTNTTGEVNKNSSPLSAGCGADLIFNCQDLMRVQTDFSQRDPYQNVVVFSHDARIVLTGGSEGILRIWNFPEMKMRSQIEVSKQKEIVDLDISHDRKFICAISKDGKCRVYSVSDCKLNGSLDLPPEDEGKFLYKRCKFGFVEGRGGDYRIFVILNPTNYKQNKSYIQQWTGPPFAISRAVPVGQALSALAVSRCGKYLAIGSMTNGDVDIYISFNLQRLKHIEKAHRTFVTGLTFLPPALSSEESVLADCDTACVSISVDNQIIVHYVERTAGISMWLAMILVIITLVSTFLLCSYLDI